MPHAAPPAAPPDPPQRSAKGDRRHRVSDFSSECSLRWDPQSYIGQWVGAGYQIRRIIGAGGMGHVYAAVNERLGGRECAVKVMTPDPAMPAVALARFLGEARAVTALADRNIVDVFDAGVLADGRPFLLMEYISGGSLADYLSMRGVLTCAEAFQIIAQVAAALHAAHSYVPPIIHRDVKLENVLIDHRPGLPLRALLTDFGVAKLSAELSGVDKTGTMQMLGSPGYMAPEIVTGGGARDADARADVYSLATMMYRLVCGRLPYQGATLYVLIGQLLTNHPYPAPRDLRADLPSGWSAVIMDALAHNRALRTPTVEAFVQQLALGLPQGALTLAQLAPRMVAVRAAADDVTLAAPGLALGFLPARAATRRWPGGDVAAAQSRGQLKSSRHGQRGLVVGAASLLVGVFVGVLVAGGMADASHRRRGAGESATATPTSLLPVAKLPGPARPSAPSPVLAEAEVAPVGYSGPALPSPSKARRIAGLVVVTAQTWANVWVDGVAYGSTPQRIRLSSGKHVLRLTGAHQTSTTVVMIKPGAVAAVDAAW
ncbi:MAG: serine/threonine protein kinase [Kofleriaceae bacterium]|nr:serine/threonine protein kinase [Kofleriaceae bacterium]